MLLPPVELLYIERGLKRLGIKSLMEYYESERWKDFREDIKFQAEPVCVSCGVRQTRVQDYVTDGDKRFMHLHHITYKHLGREKLEELCWMCSYCHSDLHNIVTDLIHMCTGKKREGLIEYAMGMLQLERESQEYFLIRNNG